MATLLLYWFVATTICFSSLEVDPQLSYSDNILTNIIISVLFGWLFTPLQIGLKLRD